MLWQFEVEIQHQFDVELINLIQYFAAQIKRILIVVLVPTTYDSLGRHWRRKKRKLSFVVVRARIVEITIV